MPYDNIVLTQDVLAKLCPSSDAMTILDVALLTSLLFFVWAMFHSYRVTRRR